MASQQKNRSPRRQRMRPSCRKRSRKASAYSNSGRRRARDTIRRTRRTSERECCVGFATFLYHRAPARPRPRRRQTASGRRTRSTEAARRSSPAGGRISVPTSLVIARRRSAAHLRDVLLADLRRVDLLRGRLELVDRVVEVERAFLLEAQEVHARDDVVL